MKARVVGAFAILLALAVAPESRAQPLGSESGLVIDLSRLQASDTDVAEGEVLFSMPARYMRTGRLQNEIRTNRRPWARPNSVPAGTPVFAQTFESLGTLWCAVSEWDGIQRSICFGSGRVYLGAPYAAPALEPGFGIQEPAEVIEDSSAEFPPMEMVYTLDRWSRDNVRLWRGLRVNGFIYRVVRLTVTRSEDGSAGINLSGRVVRFTQVGDVGARAELVSQ